MGSIGVIDLAINLFLLALFRITYRVNKGRIGRRLRIAEWAESEGFDVNLLDDSLNIHRYLHFSSLAGGMSHCFQLQVSGEFEGARFLLFELHYETEAFERDGEMHYNYFSHAGCIMHTGTRFPAKVKLRPTKLGDRLKSGVGIHDINFESVDFSRAFHVTSANRKFAYAFVHPGLMQLLLLNKKRSLEVSDDAIFVKAAGTRLRASECHDLLRFCRDVVTQVPRHLAEDKTWTPTSRK